MIGRYDTRLSGPIDTTETEFDPTKDPSLASIIDDHAVLRYLREELKYESDLKYQGPFGGGLSAGDLLPRRLDVGEVGLESAGGLDAARRIRGRRSSARSHADPRLRVLIACGWYDLMCDVVANEYAVDAPGGARWRRASPPTATSAATRCTRMPRSVSQLQRDVIAFIAGR